MKLKTIMLSICMLTIIVILATSFPSITNNDFKDENSEASSLNDNWYYINSKGQKSLVELPNKIDVKPSEDRITSYNVCYTKLLRNIV